MSCLRNFKTLLKRDGKLVITETTKDRLFTGFMLGALPDYWLSADDERPSRPFVSKAKWKQVLLDAGLAGVDIMLDNYDEPVSCTTLIVARSTSKDIHTDLNVADDVNCSNGHVDANQIEKVNEAKSSRATLVEGSFDSVVTLDSDHNSY